MNEEIQEARVINRLIKSNSWASKLKLRYWFGIEDDNDPRDGANSGEPPYGQTFQ